MADILMPLPDHDFDPTEAAVPWRRFTEAGHRIVFATPQGKPATADPRMLEGTGLGLLAPLLAANTRGRESYRLMTQAQTFRQPLAWEGIDINRFDGLILPGGHAPGMIEYLESEVLQQVVSACFAARKPVGAICHGVVLAARSNRDDGLSVLHGKRTTALLRQQELAAWLLTAAWLGDYYRTYPMTVQEEVTAALARPEDFETGPLPLWRDDPAHRERGFCVRDGHYVSARWPGDAHRFAEEMALNFA